MEKEEEKKKETKHTKWKTRRMGELNGKETRWKAIKGRDKSDKIK